MDGTWPQEPTCHSMGDTLKHSTGLCDECLGYDQSTMGSGYPPILYGVDELESCEHKAANSEKVWTVFLVTTK